MTAFFPRVNIDELLSTDSLPAPAKRADAPKKEVRLNGKNLDPRKWKWTRPHDQLESESELVPMIRKPRQPPPRPSRGRLASPTRSPSDPTSSARASEKPVSHQLKILRLDQWTSTLSMDWNQDWKLQANKSSEAPYAGAKGLPGRLNIWIACEEMNSAEFRSSVHGQARLKAGWVTIPSICIPPLTSNPKLFHRTVEILFLWQCIYFCYDTEKY